DLFGFGAPEPVRIEFWGDEIASIRPFDILDQRSSGDLERVDVLPVDLRAAAAGEPATPRSLLDVLARDAVIVELAGSTPQDEFLRTWNQVRHLHQAELRRGGSPESPEALFLMPDRASAALERFPRLRVRAHGEVEIRFAAPAAESIDRDMGAL